MRIARIFAVAALALIVATLPTLSATNKNINVILFSWDGVQREHLKECLSRNELPNLAALIKEGKLVDIDVTSHATDTKAGHAQMLTGYDPETTGVYSNSKFKPIPVGYTIFERLENTLGKDNITTVMLTGKTHHIGNCPPAKPIKPETLDPGYFPGTDSSPVSGDNTNKPTVKNPNKAKIANKAAQQNKFGEPWYLVYKNIDVWDGEKARNADVVGKLALEYLDKYDNNRFFMFFHFSDPDSQGHKFGENSKEETDAYILCDKWLGEIINKLKSHGIYKNTLIYVTSDHGFDEGKKTHKNAPHTFLATNDKKIVRGGDQKDIVPTILTEMGIDYTKFDPKLPGKSLTKNN